MYNELKNAGLTDGEAKVYLALLELGSSTTTAIIDKSGVARSFVYHILDKLLEKGLISYIEKENKKYYLTSNPERILDYIEKRKHELDSSKQEIKKVLPQLLKLRQTEPFTEIQVYEGFRGLQSAFEPYLKRLKKGEEALTLGAPQFQEERYHEYWQQDHIKRAKKGIKNRMLFNRGTDPETLKNRNSYKECEARYMETDIKTPAWIYIYKDVSQIFLQDKKKPFVVEIVNKQIAETFRAYFEDYWNKSKKFK